MRDRDRDRLWWTLGLWVLLLAALAAVLSIPAMLEH